MSNAKYIYAGIEFKTKNHVDDYIRKDILNNVKKYPEDSSLDGKDTKFLLDLLEGHHDPDKKIGAGVKKIKIRQDTDFNKRNRKFFIIRVDGTESNFSYKKCITPDSIVKKFQAACREAVSEDILYFKKQKLEECSPMCPISGKLLNRHNSHVDHARPEFRNIVEQFIIENKIDIHSVEIECEDDMGCHHARRFKDKNIRNLFRVFHSENATLQLVFDKENLIKKRS